MEVHLKFESRYSLLRVHVRDEIWDYSNPQLPRRIRPAIVAEFGFVNAEWRDSEIGERVEIVGGFFDSDEAAKRLGWTDEEKKLCEDKLLLMLETGEAGTDFRLHHDKPITVPWPNYDKTHHNQIATIAKATGSVDQALRYERANKKREGVIKALEEAWAELQEENEDALTAA